METRRSVKQAVSPTRPSHTENKQVQVMVSCLFGRVIVPDVAGGVIDKHCSVVTCVNSSYRCQSGSNDLQRSAMSNLRAGYPYCMEAKKDIVDFASNDWFLSIASVKTRSRVILQERKNILRYLCLKDGYHDGIVLSLGLVSIGLLLNFIQCMH